MNTTTASASASAASSQRIRITPDLTLTLTNPTTHNSAITGASLTGSWLWPSSLLLVHYLSVHAPPSYFAGKSVLELGAGFSGLPGLTAAGLHADHVTLTDIPEIVLLMSQNVSENVAFNEAGIVEVKSLVWGEEEEEEEHNDEDYDIVLMSDVFYDVGVMEKHGRTLRRVCGERTRMLGVTELRQWTWECLTELEKEGIESVELSVFGCCHELWAGVEGTAGVRFAVYEFMKKREDNRIVDRIDDQVFTSSFAVHEGGSHEPCNPEKH